MRVYLKLKGKRVALQLRPKPKLVQTIHDLKKEN